LKSKMMARIMVAPVERTGFTLPNDQVPDKQLCLVRFSPLEYSPPQILPSKSFYD
jgi:hypothetical protein